MTLCSSELPLVSLPSSLVDTLDTTAAGLTAVAGAVLTAGADVGLTGGADACLVRPSLPADPGLGGADGLAETDETDLPTVAGVSGRDLGVSGLDLGVSGRDLGVAGLI